MTGEAVVTDERPDDAPLRPDPILLERIEAARKGESAAFEEIMVLTERRVAQIAWRILGDAEEVKDAMQETFLRFFRHLRGYDETRDLMGWLSRIAVNASLDVQRRRRRLGIFNPLESAGPIADPGPAADDALIRRDEIAFLRRAIDTLPPKERLAVLLRDVEGLSTNEVAAALSSSAATVRVQLSRARLKIRRLLEAWRGGTQS
jgi:RNA polymerase sigma-70 factor (ECF subfamily)